MRDALSVDVAMVGFSSDAGAVAVACVVEEAVDLVVRPDEDGGGCCVGTGSVTSI